MSEKMNPSEQLEADFAYFWQHFDPRSRFSAEEKIFFRHLWLVLRAFKFDGAMPEAPVRTTLKNHELQ